MQDVVWHKISESSNGNFLSYYARLPDGFLIKDIERVDNNQEYENINFFPINEKETCEFEFEEL